MEFGAVWTVHAWSICDCDADCVLGCGATALVPCAVVALYVCNGSTGAFGG